MTQAVNDDILLDKGENEMDTQIRELYERMLHLYQLSFGVQYEGEEDIVVLALTIRNDWKGNHSIPKHWRNRFHRIILELETTDYRIGERFMAGCN